MLDTLLYYIKTSYRWFLRCGYTRGFGIQSPSAYSFVRNVINQHDPYYAYEDLEEEMKGQPLQFRKLGRLFFRLANFWQAHDVVMSSYDYVPYINAGCHKSLVKMIDDYDFENALQPVLVILKVDWLEEESIRQEVLENSSDQMLLVLMDIYANRKNNQLWKQIHRDEHCGVTYDLYTCGIIFFDKSKYKQDFKINF